MAIVFILVVGFLRLDLIIALQIYGSHLLGEVQFLSRLRSAVSIAVSGSRALSCYVKFHECVGFLYKESGPGIVDSLGRWPL